MGKSCDSIICRPSVHPCSSNTSSDPRSTDLNIFVTILYNVVFCFLLNFFISYLYPTLGLLLNALVFITTTISGTNSYWFYIYYGNNVIYSVFVSSTENSTHPSDNGSNVLRHFFICLHILDNIPPTLCDYLLWLHPIDIDFCHQNPCLNGGTCVDIVTGYICVCAMPQFSGTLCEIGWFPTVNMMVGYYFVYPYNYEYDCCSFVWSGKQVLKCACTEIFGKWILFNYSIFKSDWTRVFFTLKTGSNYCFRLPLYLLKCSLHTYMFHHERVKIFRYGQFLSLQVPSGESLKKILDWIPHYKFLFIPYTIRGKWICIDTTNRYRLCCDRPRFWFS